ncbi:MAG: aspartyl/glutamyl-tRNA(Asn/Gln) amidotransferase subunit [Thermoleophilia bacterium]|nr:aspartyl/glutamyl-tRNA(Asn/Gln) amidotransferase subunit [Thermoleophilia bacterium]
MSTTTSTAATELSADALEAWDPTIGLEIHIQLLTNTKMFCRCRLEFGAEPNTHVCPVCLAHPGVLPVPNKRAVDFAVMIGLALNCEIAPRTIFHRKNYFYADSPKAYQISQYDNPICGEGYLDVPDGSGGTFRVGITRAHMEEDAAKLVHSSASGRIADSSHSFVDFNRVCTPLVEIVTEPDIKTADHARRFLTVLRNTIRTIGVSDVNMEEGSLRCDANISVAPRGETELGTKTELKNMNSFRFIERGINAELVRQVNRLESGDRVEQETLHYDNVTGALRSLRSKEAAHDYRYFPEPDLVPIEVTPEHIERVRAEMPELPLERMQRFVTQYGLSAYDADVLNQLGETADYYEAAVAAAKSADAKVVANWTMGELAALQKDGKDVSAEQLASLVDLVAKKTISGAVAKELLVRIADEGIDPVAVVEAEGLAQVSDSGALTDVINGILDANPAQVEQFKGGKETLVGFFVGQVMKAMQGKADPAATKDLVIQLLQER